MRPPRPPGALPSALPPRRSVWTRGATPCVPGLNLASAGEPANWGRAREESGNTWLPGNDAKLYPCLGAAGKQRILSRCSGPQELMHKPQKVFREGTPPPPPRLMTPTEPALFVVSPFLKGKWGSCCAWCQQLTPSERWFPGSCALFRTGPTGEWTRFRNERRDGRPGLCGGAFPSVGNLAQHQGAGLCVPGSWLLWGVHLLMDFTACTLEMVLSVADFREN